MNVNLGAQWEAFIDQNLKSGRYVSASEVVRDGLRLLQEREQFRQLRMDELRRNVKVGLDALDRGEYLEFDEEGLKAYLDDANAQGEKRLAKKGSKMK